METYDPTIEEFYRRKVQIDGKSCMLEVLDTSGQDEYIPLREQWIRDGEGFILVYSICSRSSFVGVARLHQQILSFRQTDPVQLPPLMLVGNKRERVMEREVSTQEGAALAREWQCEFVEASARTFVNVEKAFYDVVRQIRRGSFQSRFNSRTSLEQLQWQPPAVKKGVRRRILGT